MTLCLNRFEWCNTFDDVCFNFNDVGWDLVLDWAVFSDGTCIFNAVLSSILSLLRTCWIILVGNLSTITASGYFVLALSNSDGIG